MTSLQDDFYPIGFIKKPHGLKGEMSIRINEDVDLDAIKTVFVEQRGQRIPFHVEKFSGHSKNFIKVEGVDTITDAELLMNSTLYLHHSDPGLQQSERFNLKKTLSGKTVVDKNRGNIGIVESIEQIGSIDYIKIETPAHEEILIPLNSPFFTQKGKIKTNSKLSVDLPEGYPGL